MAPQTTIPIAANILGTIGTPARPRRPSNFFPGIENLSKTHNEEVSDALADYLSQRPTKSLSESIWAKKPDTSLKPTPQPSSPAPASATEASPPAAQGEIPREENAEVVQSARLRRPSNFFPGIENLSKTHNEEVSDALADYLSQRPTKSLSESIWAKKPDTSLKPTPRRSSPAPTQAPQPPTQPDTGAIPRAPPAPPPPPNPPPGPRADSTIWSPRGNERGRGGAHGRAPPHTPTQPGVGARAPLGTPRIPPPPAGPGAGRSGSSRRGNRRGRGGGARGGAAAPAPNAAGESFRRLQERIARATAAEKKEKD